MKQIGFALALSTMQGTTGSTVAPIALR